MNVVRMAEENDKSTPPQSCPKLASLCGTYLKAEMQSIYRQVKNIRKFTNVVFCEQTQNLEQFPFSPVIPLTKLCTPRAKGNFLLRFWYKYVVKQWPPPREINKLPPGPHFPYDLPKQLAAHQIDLVHVYYGHKAVKYLPMIQHWGGPFIVSFHGVDVSKFCDQPGYREDLLKVFAEAKLVLARSKSLLAEVQALGCPPEKLRLNRTPIPLDAFPAHERAAPEDGSWRLIQASRLIPKKGLFTTLEALTKVVPQFPKLKFIICGTGPIKEELLARRDALGLKDHVSVRGWLNQTELADEYRRSHVFLHPSELTESADQEGIPNSMLEAMGTGLPVVATYHGGIPEAVTHEVDGLLVPEKDPTALAQAIIEILSQPDKLGALSRAAAATVRQNFGLNEQVAHLEACYQEALMLNRRNQA
jgi:colanic acid/amylovoran biosynthesis glycosyltransferase